MLDDHDPVARIWAALLRLDPNDQDAFLHHACAYRSASAGRGRKPGLIEQGFAEAAPAPVLAELPDPSRLMNVPSGGAIDAARSAVPLIGGPDLDLGPRTTFVDPRFRRAWRPGIVLHVYVSGCRGLRDIMRTLGQYAYCVDVERQAAMQDVGAGKVGTACDVPARMAKLGRGAYGSISKADRAAAPGFDCWTPEALPTAALDPSPGSPVCVLGHAFQVTLPASVTAMAFDQALGRALAPATLSGWAMSVAGQALCMERGVDPRTLVRGTPGSKGRITWASEIVLIRPRHSALRLLRLCEDLVTAMTTMDAVAGPARSKKEESASPRWAAPTDE